MTSNQEAKKEEDEIRDNILRFVILDNDDKLQINCGQLEKLREEDEQKKCLKIVKRIQKAYYMWRWNAIEKYNKMKKEQAYELIIYLVKMEGFVWEKDYEKLPFTFGVEKLFVSCIIDIIRKGGLTHPFGKII